MRRHALRGDDVRRVSAVRMSACAEFGDTRAGAELQVAVAISPHIRRRPAHIFESRALDRRRRVKCMRIYIARTGISASQRCIEQSHALIRSPLAPCASPLALALLPRPSACPLPPAPDSISISAEATSFPALHVCPCRFEAAPPIPISVMVQQSRQTDLTPISQTKPAPATNGRSSVTRTRTASPR